MNKYTVIYSDYFQTGSHRNSIVLMEYIECKHKDIVNTLLEKNIEIVFETPENLEIYADENILVSVIRNLVSNAVKFTPQGGKITVSAKIRPDKCVEFSVRDTGIGMDKNLLENLFRIDSNTGRRGTAGE